MYDNHLTNLLQLYWLIFILFQLKKL